MNVNYLNTLKPKKVKPKRIKASQRTTEQVNDLLRAYSKSTLTLAEFNEAYNLSDSYLVNHRTRRIRKLRANIIAVMKWLAGYTVSVERLKNAVSRTAFDDVTAGVLHATLTAATAPTAENTALVQSELTKYFNKSGETADQYELVIRPCTMK